MEKLQAAIEKARAERGQDAPRPTRQATGAARPRTRGAPPVEAAWEALAPFTPDTHLLLRNRVVTSDSDREAAAFDMLRTKVLKEMSAHSWRRIALTSPGAGSGKTTTAANLALSLSRMRDIRIVMIDLDLRLPALGRVLGIDRDQGFVDVLNGEVPFAEQAVRIGHNLAISVNVRREQSPAEQLARTDTAALLDQIERDYQPNVMIFDMPPILAADDVTVFTQNTDCGLIIAEAERTTIPQLDACETQLSANTNVIGVVLNKCRYRQDGYDYAYYD